VSRIEQLQTFVAQSPNDPFPRYGLAIEYKNAGRLDDAARAFAELLGRFPDYTAAYLHAGTVLLELRRRAEAEAVWRAGVEACARKRDLHAKGELEAALENLVSME
jgi:predicted Zn-dependent protease